MIGRNWGLILVIMLAFVVSVKADIAPDPDEMRVTADWLISTDEDLSDYRFFLDFMGDLREVEVKNKASTVLESKGGGARYSVGTLIAIPKSSLKGFDAAEAISQAIRDKKIEGVTELGKHQFSRTIKISERKNWTYPTYRIERDGNSLKLLKIGDVSPKLNLEEEAQINSDKYFMVTMAAGVLLTLAILIFGVFLFRKVWKKG